MEKIITPGSWDFGVAQAALLKVSSHGLRGSDLDDFVKRSSDSFAHSIRDFVPPADTVPMHLIAIGSTDYFGPNRNGDGFKEACCRKYHDTFVKHGRYNRGHLNKRAEDSYGTVKFSTYNEAMHRVELLVLLSATKEAAARHGGQVADKEIERLGRGDDVPVSMAARLPYDECSSCFNKSATRKEYCTEESCIAPSGEKRGGCKNNLTKVCEDGHVLHVDNPHPQFFDISGVFRGADRIAYGAKADYLLNKAASGEVVGGAELAELWGVSSPFSGHVAAKLDLLQKLASCEQAPPTASGHLLSVAYQGRPAFALQPLETTHTKQAAAWSALQEQNVMLPLDAFLQLHKIAMAVTDVAQHMPIVFSRLLEDPQLEQKLASDAYDHHGVPTESLRRWAHLQAQHYGADVEQTMRRAKLAALRGALPKLSTDIRGMFTKSAAVSSPASAAAERYGLYQLAFLHKMSTQNAEHPLTLRAVVLQNNCI